MVERSKKSQIGNDRRQGVERKKYPGKKEKRSQKEGKEIIERIDARHDSGKNNGYPGKDQADKKRTGIARIIYAESTSPKRDITIIIIVP